MTNAEKYLKEGVSIEEFAYAYAHVEQEALNGIHPCNIKHFLRQPVKPTLTEDERVILRYVDGEYTHIQRACGLWLVKHKNEYNAEMMSFEMYSHLFQFIKERRRIRNKGVTR